MFYGKILIGDLYMERTTLGRQPHGRVANDFLGSVLERCLVHVLRWGVRDHPLGIVPKGGR